MATQVDTYHWRDSARTAKFFLGIDARASFGLLAVIVYWSTTTLYIGLTCMLFFGILGWFKISIPVFFRLVRVFLAGKYRPSKPWWAA
ncbi:MAG: IcmT/TraK family protein [Gammaproteobacteria bacterium]